MPALNIRSASPDDVPLVLRFVRELAAYERSLDKVVATEPMLMEAMFGRIHGRGPLVEGLIGEIDGSPQGFALFFHTFSTWVGASGLYLEDLYVTPEARGAGLGKALLRHLAQIAVERGCGRVEWAVLNWNEPAIGFYKRLGARPLDEWTYYRLAGEAINAVAEGSV
jgi:GNAT superfamily N-acetyltransferase